MTRSPRHSRTAIVCLCGVALSALLCVDCFNVTNSRGWSDLSRAPHLAAIAQTTSSASTRTAAATSPVAAMLPSTIFVLALLVLLGAVGRAPERLRGSGPSPPRPGRSPPPSLLVPTGREHGGNGNG